VIHLAFTFLFPRARFAWRFFFGRLGTTARK
jgi:hypothetical protein